LRTGVKNQLAHRVGRGDCEIHGAEPKEPLRERTFHLKRSAGIGRPVSSEGSSGRLNVLEARNRELERRETVGMGFDRVERGRAVTKRGKST